MKASQVRGASFADWKIAAERGYIAGGMTRTAAAAIVDAAAENIAPLVTQKLTGELLHTFALALDLECGLYVRRNGAAALV